VFLQEHIVMTETSGHLCHDTQMSENTKAIVTKAGDDFTGVGGDAAWLEPRGFDHEFTTKSSSTSGASSGERHSTGYL
jgi:hypothetical protein